MSELKRYNVKAIYGLDINGTTNLYNEQKETESGKYCLSEDVEKLEAENKRLREAFKDTQDDIETCLAVLNECISDRQSLFDYKLFSALNKCLKLAQ